MPIQILAPEVANQIAAGEVVERPASVVKELIENSLDAGATDIRVEIREGGRRLVRVQDDGCGIPVGETHLLFRRHATSKISSTDDLNRLTTLGFRGEALASIAAVAHVTLLTRARGEELGTLIRVAEGREVDRQPVGGPVGTTVTVEHLFANIPARLKFLKRPATEAGHIHEIVTRYALAYPERRLSLVSDGRLVFQSSGSGRLYDVLVRVYGPEMAKQMLPLAEDGSPESPAEEEQTGLQPSVRVAGYVSAPGLNRSNRNYISLFINRRWFQDASLAYSVIQAYHTLLPTGRYPVALIFISMDPADVDVNVHPTKAEVRFRDSQAVFRAVQRAVRRAVVAHAPIPALGLEPSTMSGEPAWSSHTPFEEEAPRRPDLAAGPVQPIPPVVLRPPAQESVPRQPSFPGPAAIPGRDRQLVPILRVVGQLSATYIVAEGPDGLYLIDQHAAHERILYEQMLTDHAAGRTAVQPLLEPVVLELKPEQAAVVAEALETLNELGIAIEPFGGHSYLVRTMPALLSRDEPESALTAIIDSLVSADNLVENTREARLVTAICKRAAIKGGQVLSMSEMQELVRRLEACQTPRTCPHGRPTMIYLSAAELARQFGRT